MKPEAVIVTLVLVAILAGLSWLISFIFDTSFALTAAVCLGLSIGIALVAILLLRPKHKE